MRGFAWIQLHVDFDAHPLVLELCAVLEDELAWAYLEKLWRWAAKVCPTGELSTMSDANVGRAAGYTKDPRAFGAALRAVGLIDADGRIHDWQELYGKALDRRESEAERLRQHRAAKGQRADGVRSTSVVRTQDVRSTYGGRTATKEEEGEKESTPPLPPSGGSAAGAAGVCVPAPPKEPEPQPRRRKPVDGALAVDLVEQPADEAATVWAVAIEAGLPWVSTRRRVGLLHDRLAEGASAEELVRALGGYLGHPWWRERPQFITFDKVFGSREGVETGLALRTAANWRDPFKRTRAPPGSPPEPTESPPAHASIAELRSRRDRLPWESPR